MATLVIPDIHAEHPLHGLAYQPACYIAFLALDDHHRHAYAALIGNAGEHESLVEVFVVLEAIRAIGRPNFTQHIQTKKVATRKTTRIPARARKSEL